MRLILVMAVVVVVALSSCSVTRHLPEDAYLLKRNVIKVDRKSSRGERISAGEFDRYVQQSPNRRFLGTNLYAWLYSQAKPEKDNGWNRFLRRVGEEPVIWSPEKTELTRQNFERYMVSRGFFENEAWYEIDTLRNRKIRVTYDERQREVSRIASIKYNFRDRSLEEPVMCDSAATLLHAGDIFDENVMGAERERIASMLRDRGYYDFNAGNITYEYSPRDSDNLKDLTMIVHHRLDGYNEDGTATYTDNKTYRIKDIYVYPDYDPLTGTAGRIRLPADTVMARGLNIVYHGKLKIRPRILERAIRFRADSVYSAGRVATTSGELMRLGTFRSVSVLFDRVEDSLLRCDIRAVPALRQSFRGDLEGSTTSSFYGLRATVGYQNRNLMRGAELFDASVTAGFEFIKAKDSDRKLSYELGANVSLTFPRFLFFWDIDKLNRAKTPSTRLALSAGWQDRVYYRRALFGFNWGYSWGVRRFGNISVRPVDVNLVRMSYMNPDFERELNNPYLVESYADQLIAGISASYVYNNQPRDLNAGAVVFRANAETTGNLFSGLTRLFSKPTAAGHYNMFGIRFSQYLRGDVSFSQKIVLGDKTAIAYRLQGGAIFSYGNSTSTPFDKQFFAGGVNSMRGWAVRTLGPGTQLYERQNYPAQMGDVKLEANVEFRFPVWNAFRGAMFFDTGNIWFMRSKPGEYPDEAVFRFNNFYRQLALNTGVGLRVDLRFVVLRLDWGIQLHSPGRPAGERWIHDFKWRNTALNFGVGYPF
jgi:outer membrane protein assembly factor BamA